MKYPMIILACAASFSNAVLGTPTLACPECEKQKQVLMEQPVVLDPLVSRAGELYASRKDFVLQNWVYPPYSTWGDSYKWGGSFKAWNLDYRMNPRHYVP